MAISIERVIPKASHLAPKKENTMFKKVVIISLLAFLYPAYAANYLDTQYGQDGIEVHLLKAKVANKVLTVSFMFENSSEEEIKFRSMVIANANYTSTENKYPVLKDVNGKWLASTITYDEKASYNSLFTHKESPEEYHHIRFKPGNKRVGWVKFEAPSEDAWPIEVTLPGVSPFTIEKP